MTQDLKSILDYHRNTAHIRGALTGRALNWENKPHPFKMYRDVPVFHLPHDITLPDIGLDQVLLSRPLPADADMPKLLAGLCHLAAGITQRRNHADGKVVHFRAEPSAGALYPAELYVALQNVTGMSDGLYHYCPMRHVLSQLRTGRVFSGTHESAIRFFITTIHQRSAWKYGDRAYRYCLLDAGHMAENLLLAARMHGLPGVLDYDFNDATITRFLGLDPDYEGCLIQLHAIGCGPETAMSEAAHPTVDSLSTFSRLGLASTSPGPVLAAHAITASFARCPACPPDAHHGEASPLPESIVPASTSATIKARRSRRNFVPRAISIQNYTDILGLICRDVPPVCADAIQVGFLAAPNSGFAPGYYCLNRNDNSISRIRSGNLLPQSARVCLDQGWLENAALHLVFTADLNALNHKCGPRAYRYAHIEAGRLGQHAYLAATAKNLGACGIGAFFDGEAASLLALPEGHALLYLVGIGPVRGG